VHCPKLAACPCSPEAGGLGIPTTEAVAIESILSS